MVRIIPIAFLLFIGDQNAEFSRFRSLLPKISAPYTMWCGFRGDGLTKKDLPLELQRLSPRFGISGEIVGNFSVVPILFFEVGEILYPYLYTFDKSGKVIDVLDFNITCFGDPEGVQTSHILIDKSLAITVTDTLRITTTANRDSLVIHIRQFQMKQSGQFKTRKDTTFSRLE